MSKELKKPWNCIIGEDPGELISPVNAIGMAKVIKNSSKNNSAFSAGVRPWF